MIKSTQTKSLFFNKIKCKRIVVIIRFKEFDKILRFRNALIVKFLNAIIVVEKLKSFETKVTEH
jgi:hypothetical protein